MVKVWTYGIFSYERGTPSTIGLLDSMYLGKATLRNFERVSTSHIQPKDGKSVVGDLWEVPERVRHQLKLFEEGVGWMERLVTVIDEEGVEHRAYAYIYE